MSWLATEAISAGQVPFWTFFMGTGSPYLQNYGFAFFYLVGVVDLVFSDLFLSLKLTMASFGHLLSGLGMYFLVTGHLPFAPRRVRRRSGLRPVLLAYPAGDHHGPPVLVPFLCGAAMGIPLRGARRRLAPQDEGPPSWAG